MRVGDKVWVRGTDVGPMAVTEVRSGGWYRLETGRCYRAADLDTESDRRLRAEAKARAVAFEARKARARELAAEINRRVPPQPWGLEVRVDLSIETAEKLLAMMGSGS